MKVIRLRPLGLVALFLAGVFCLYLGFYGVAAFQHQNDVPKVKNNVVEVSSKQGAPSSAFFVNYRQNRENDRDRQVQILQELIDDPNAAAETRATAQKTLLALNRQIAKESEIENLVLAKGFKDVVATLGSNDLNLMVYGEKLSPSELTKLQDIAVRSTGIRLENIVIIPKI